MEPGTPTPSITRDGAEIPLAWSKRSEAVLSRHGHTMLSLVELMRKRRTGLYALCLGIHAALPAAHAPESPEDIADWLADEAGQVKASGALLTLWKHHYPKAAEKKRGSTR